VIDEPEKFLPRRAKIARVGGPRLSNCLHVRSEIFYPRASAQIRGKFFSSASSFPLRFKGFLSQARMRHFRGGVLLTVITTSHTPLSMNNRTAGTKYLLAGTC
jgi:hypothetical protein